MDKGSSSTIGSRALTIREARPRSSEWWCQRGLPQHRLTSGLGRWARCLPAARRDRWRELLTEAADADPGDFPNNGWVVHALQAAWAAIHRAGIDVTDANTANPQSLRMTLQHAINAGGDTDTVAAIAGQLAGALAGADSIPLGWQRMLHGWGGVNGEVLDGPGLIKLAVVVHDNCGRDPSGPVEIPTHVNYDTWPGTDAFARHPHDPGVFIGGVDALDHLPDDIDAVVSLCRVGTKQVPPRIGSLNAVQSWLLDNPAEAENPHLSFVLEDAADAVAAFRAEGKTVYLRCVAAHSRTPTVAALYSVRHCGIDDAHTALDDALTVLPAAQLDTRFAALLDEYEVEP